MEQFDIIGQLRTYAESENMHFLCGSRWQQNYAAAKKIYDNGQLVLAASFNASPVFSKAGKISEIRYRGVIMLGRKFEVTTASQQTETYEQKYDNRLVDLAQGLAAVISDFACANQLTISGVDMVEELNRFDTNIDFVAATVTLLQ